MKTNKEQRAMWRVTGNETEVRLIDDVEEATRLLNYVLDRVPPMSWLIENGQLASADAPKFAQMIGDAYVFLEEPS